MSFSLCDDQELKTAHPVGADQEGAGEHLFERLEVNGDAGHGLAQGAGADVEQAAGGGADEDDMAGQQGRQPGIVVGKEAAGG